MHCTSIKEFTKEPYCPFDNEALFHHVVKETFDRIESRIDCFFFKLKPGGKRTKKTAPLVDAIQKLSSSFLKSIEAPRLMVSTTRTVKIVIIPVIQSVSRQQLYIPFFHTKGVPDLPTTYIQEGETPLDAAVREINKCVTHRITHRQVNLALNPKDRLDDDIELAASVLLKEKKNSIFAPQYTMATTLSISKFIERFDSNPHMLDAVMSIYKPEILLGEVSKVTKRASKEIYLYMQTCKKVISLLTCESEIVKNRLQGIKPLSKNSHEYEYFLKRMRFMSQKIWSELQGEYESYLSLNLTIRIPLHLLIKDFKKKTLVSVRTSETINDSVARAMKVEDPIDVRIINYKATSFGLLAKVVVI